MKAKYLMFLGLMIQGVVHAQIGVKFDNSEESSYISSMKSPDFTYVIWDRNDGGGNLFSSSTTPKFMYWDDDDNTLGYLIDTRNMGQLRASLFSLNVSNDITTLGQLGVGTNSPQDGRLHIYKDGTTGGWGSIDKTKAALRIQDNGSSMYLDGNTIYTSGNTHFGPMTNHYLTLGTNGAERLRINQQGNIGIGTTTPDAKLTVKGDIHAEKVTVDLNIPAPDYVFEADYDLRSLEETDQYIKANKHLPEVPSAKELEASGIDLVEMNMLLLKKIEELTLYVIEQQKEIELIKRKN